MQKDFRVTFNSADHFLAPENKLSLIERNRIKRANHLIHLPSQSHHIDDRNCVIADVFSNQTDDALIGRINYRFIAFFQLNSTCELLPDE